jgi:hypothetical protein
VERASGPLAAALYFSASTSTMPARPTGGSDAFVFVMTNGKVTTYHHDYEKHFAQATCVATRGRGGTERDSKSQTKERPRVTLHSIALSCK